MNRRHTLLLGMPVLLFLFQQLPAKEPPQVGPKELLPAEAIWRMRYDTKLDGEVAGKDVGEVRWRLTVRNGRIFGSLAEFKEGDAKDHRVAGEIVDGQPPIVHLRQDGPKGLVCYYTGKYMAETRIVGAWFDNRGNSGDFEFVPEKVGGPPKTR